MSAYECHLGRVYTGALFYADDITISCQVFLAEQDVQNM